MQFFGSIVVLVVLLQLTTNCLAQNKIVCYYGSWGTYTEGEAHIPPESIDPYVCTHLIYSFISLTVDGDIIVMDPYADLPSGLDGFRKFVGLKAQNPSLKTMVAIGGWEAGSEGFSQVSASPDKRAAFVNNVVGFIREYGFDGLDLDWEYPSLRGGVPADKENFVSLVRDLRGRFDGEQLLLSIAVPGDSGFSQQAYDVASLNMYLDFINIMAYDFHTYNDGKTGQNAGLYASSADASEVELRLNADAGINYWLSNGASANKLVLGMGTYGASFTLASDSSTWVGAPTVGPGIKGQYTNQEGLLGYNEICKLQQEGGWTVVFDNQQKVPYAFRGDQWVGYDDVQSVRAKSEYILSRGLAGGMFWSLNTEDILGLCFGTRYPLVNAMKNVLNRGKRE